MASQGEREPGVLGMCRHVGSMAQVGSFYKYNPTTNCGKWERLEHELCRQTESHNGSAIAPQRSTERADINSTTNGTARGVSSQSLVQTTWSRHVPWQAWQDDYVSIGRLQAQLWDVLEKVKRYEEYIEEVQRGVDESQRHADALQKNYVYGGTQRLDDLLERIRWQKHDLANRVDKLRGKKNLVVFYTRHLEYAKSKLNKRIEEQQIGISQERKQWEEEWKTELEKKQKEHDLEVKQLMEKLLEEARRFKELEGRVREIQLEEKKCEHDGELEQLKEEIRTGNQERESLEWKIKRGERQLEERAEELLEKSEQFEELQGELREEGERKTKLEKEKRKRCGIRTTEARGKGKPV